MKYYLSLFLFILIFISCKKEKYEIVSTGDYFPLEVGNYWQLDSISKIEVIGKKYFGDTCYYIFVEMKDTVYYRKDSNRILQRNTQYINNKNTEYIKFDLNLNFNKYPYRGVYVVYRYFPEETSTVIFGNKKYENCICYQFYWAGCGVCSYYYTLAPGIGFIQIGFNSTIIEAKIHNTIIRSNN